MFLLSLGAFCSTLSGAWAGDIKEADLIVSVSAQVRATGTVCGDRFSICAFCRGLHIQFRDINVQRSCERTSYKYVHCVGGQYSDPGTVNWLQVINMWLLFCVFLGGCH